MEAGAWVAALSIAVGGPILVAVVFGIVRAWPVIRDLGRFVLPHFIPPPPGQPDVTLPARMQRVEEGAVRVATDLAGHVAEEIELRKADMAVREADMADRQERQAHGDERMRHGDERMARLEAGQDQIAQTLTSALAELRGGNPEVRPSLRRPS